MSDYDVVVAGAGPAGTSAAVRAARQGLRVLLADKTVAPRQKCWAVGLLPPALAAMEALGLGEALDGLGLKSSSDFVAFSPRGTPMRARNPKVGGMRDRCTYIRRRTLDKLLLDFAREVPGVTVLDGCRVDGLVRRDGRVCGVHATVGGRTREFLASFVVGADGARSVVARECGLLNDRPAHHVIALRAYFEHVEGLDDYHYNFESYMTPGYGWLLPLEGGMADVGVGYFAGSRSPTELHSIFERFLASNAVVKRALQGATMVPGSRLARILPLGSFPSPRHRGNVLLAGDAGSFCDTLTAAGIANAFRTGELAARAVCEAHRAGHPDDAGAAYQRDWRRELQFREFFLGSRLRTLVSHELPLEATFRFFGSSDRRASVMGGVLKHVLPKWRLLYNL